MHLLPIFCAVVFASFIFTAPAHAYLDPGTGSMIFQAVAAAVLAAAATGKIWWSKVKGLFGGHSSKKSDHDEK